MNEQKILYMLKEIKSICNDNVCADCPFSDDKFRCILQKYSPGYWVLTDKIPEKWSAFRFEDME